MSAGRELAAPAALPTADGGEPGGGAQGEAGSEERRKIDVAPEDVFQREPLPRPSWAHNSFFAPILAVVGLSAALLYGLLLLLASLWSVLG